MTGKTPEFTPLQLSAVNTRRGGERRGPLLISAGAGSGKTKVLVERLLRYISGSEGSFDITQFLIITYTRAAAGELRSRILEEISERLAREPDNRHLRRQAALVYEAPIGTIHSFCTDVLRENAHLAGLSPDFRVADESEAVILKDKVLEDVLESRYETIEEMPGFQQLVDTMSAGRDDKKLMDIVLEAHGKLLSHAEPEKWISRQLDTIGCSIQGDAGDTAWGRFLMNDAAKKVSYWLNAMRRLQDDISAHPDFRAAYGDSLAATVQSLVRLDSALGHSWDEARACAAVDFPRPKNIKGYEELKEIRTRCKDALKKLAAVFECASAEHFEDMAAVSPAVAALLQLVLDFDSAYGEAKRKRGIVDFSDLEHLTARLLTDGETGVATDTAVAISRRYREIMVDEYQDVSRVQEKIFCAVSQGGMNLFMVGDVKQSIYRFRLADPAIFLSKYKSFQDAGEDPSEGAGLRVLLSTNFRSRAGILEAVNHVFRNVMSEEFGEMAYTKREFLYPGRTDGDTDEPAVELNILDTHGIETEEDEEAPEKTAVEADFVAARIAALIGSGITVPDGQGGSKPLTYGDFAILLRSVKDKAALYEKALSDRNIPAALPGGEDFFAALEVSVTISLLSVIDNPMQDIPLIAVLRSPVFGFTPDELAEIRMADKSADFYGALAKAAAESLKCRAFLDTLEEFRLIAPDMSADRLIWYLYNKTDMLAVMGALRGGNVRRQNLMRLIDLAVRCEAGGYKGLFGFMTLVRKLIKNGEEPFGAGDIPSGDAVKIMSIHKSKGLEFPVVILTDTTKRFNKKDAAAPLLIHSELGVGAKRTDLTRRIEYPTLARLAVSKKLTQEMLSEELRVLYVAMTRAREKLIIVATYNDAERELVKLSKDASAPVAPQALENVQSMAGFILLPALTRPEAAGFGLSAAPLSTECGTPWDIRKIAPAEGPSAVSNNQQSEPPCVRARQEDIDDFRKNLEYVYPFQQASLIPSKLTATSLKGRFADFEAAEEAERLGEKTRQPANRPNFVTLRAGLSAAERGTALHLAMQYIDYKKCGTVEETAGELGRLKEKNFLSSRQAEAVNPEKITAFFRSALGQRVLNAGTLYREFKFSLLVPAGDYFPDSRAGVSADDEILLQGVVDCCFEENGGLHIIDFKTDYVTAQTLEEKKGLYRPQLNAYAQAMERITGKPVKSRLIYFFALDAAYEL